MDNLLYEYDKKVNVHVLCRARRGECPGDLCDEGNPMVDHLPRAKMEVNPWRSSEQTLELIGVLQHR